MIRIVETMLFEPYLEYLERLVERETLTFLAKGSYRRHAIPLRFLRRLEHVQQ
jgi:hypothetical protein